MAINADRFSFNNKHSDTDFSLVICGIGNELSDTTSGGSKFEINNYYSPISKCWKRIGYKYSEPLEFEFDVVKNTCNGADESFSVNDIEQIERWLMRIDEDKPLILFKDGYEQITFYGTFVSVDIKSVGGNDIGLSLKFQSNAPFGYGSKMMYSTSLNNKTVIIEDTSTEIGEKCADLEIKCNSDTNVIITNSFNNETMEINNCVAGETIVIDGKTKIITSSVETHNIYDDFNFCYLHIGNSDTTNQNTIVVQGDAYILITHQPIRKVGV